MHYFSPVEKMHFGWLFLLGFGGVIRIVLLICDG